MILTRCCCYCTLSQGTKAIAIYNLIRVVFLVMGLIMILLDPSDYEQTFSTPNSVRNLIAYAGITTMVLVFSVKLILGVQKRKTSYILPFLVLDAMIICALFYSLISNTLFCKHCKMNEEAILRVITNLFLGILEIYLYLIVISYYHQLSQEKQNEKLREGNEDAPPVVYTHVKEHVPEDKPPPYSSV